MHGPPSGPVKPALQVHADWAELAIGDWEAVGHTRHVPTPVAATAVEYVFPAQVLHAAVPVVVLYFPATHAVHGPDPSGPVNPTLHVQAARIELAVGELELVGQARQVVATVAPTVVEYVPAPQSMQVALPVVVLYLPATQAVHGPPFGPV